MFTPKFRPSTSIVVLTSGSPTAAEQASVARTSVGCNGEVTTQD